MKIPRRMTAQDAVDHKKRIAPVFNDINNFNSRVFRRAKALGGNIEIDADGRPIVTVPEHAIKTFNKWMEKQQ